MAVTKQQLMGMDPDEVFDWDSDNLDAGLKELDITIGKNWSKSKKAHELSKAIGQLKPTKHAEIPLQSQDNPNLMMFQALQAMQQQMKQDREESRDFMAAQIQEIQNTNAAQI